MIIGCIYQHPSISSTKFVDAYISELIQHFLKGDKTITLMGVFNIDFLKYNTNADTEAFLDSMYTNFLLPYIPTPRRVTTHSKRLNHNIFSDNIVDGLISGSNTTIISDNS